MNKLNAPRTLAKLLIPIFASLFWTEITSAQWIMYNFSPQAAYQSSYGLTTNTNSTSTSILTNGWSTTWSNSTTNNRGILAVQFSTNTNTPNIITCLPPLIYTYNSTNTNKLTTANYTNIPQIALTNANAVGSNSWTNACYIARTLYSSNTWYMVGQYSLIYTNTTNVGTNSVGTFNSICVGYPTATIGTNGVPTTSITGTTNYYPAVLQLKISSINGFTPLSLTNQQLILPLTINTALTKIVNTNTNFGTNGTPIPTSNIYTNLVKCIQSNQTYTNF